MDGGLVVLGPGNSARLLEAIDRTGSDRGMMCAMRVATGRVIQGKVVIEGPPLEEGSLVTVLAREQKETFELSSEEEAELLLSIAEADRGETVPGEEVVWGLPSGQA